MRRSVCFLCLFIASMSLYAQIPSDVQKQAQHSKSLTSLAAFFIGKPYVANSLAHSAGESLLYSFQAFDCVTFIETICALYTTKGNQPAFEKALVHWRYRNDSIRYETRQHYFSAAMNQLSKDGLLQEILGEGVRRVQVHKNFGYLSRHLPVEQANTRSSIETTEQGLAKLPFAYIPTNKIDQLSFQDGDIIAFVPRRADLDFTHVGFAYLKHKQVYILHASQQKKRVCISDENLLNYLVSHKQFIGIRLYRPIFVS